ncbi:MAG: HD domain-containing protein [Candidatus Magasanikbacteria bacterium]|jgi:tRNA nucleotidyltransferase (CCA-adding enzyme)
MKVEKLFKEIATLAKQEKTPVYAVGGFVRDLLLDCDQKKDIDFVVEGSGLAFARALDKKLKEEGSLVEFSDFDTARYVIRSKEKGVRSNDNDGEIVLEFAGARAESYHDKSRKPKVVATTLKDDLSRRDFTVNAMALPVDAIGKKTWKKLIIDEFNGQEDLKNKILRTPLDPDITFSDDPLRMLRAIRFAAQLNFSIEPKTLEAIYRNRERIKIVSAERVQEELMKLMTTNAPGNGLVLMFQTHLMDLVLPEVSALDGVEEIWGHIHKNNLIHSFKVVDNIALRSDKPLLRLAGLLHDIGKAGTKKFLPKIGWTFHAHEHLGKKLASDLMRRLRFPISDIKYVAKLVRYHQQPIALMDDGITDSAVRRLIVNLGDQLEDLLILGVSDITTGNPTKFARRQKNYDYLRARIDEVIEKDKLRAFQSPLRGDEIMTLAGLKPGPTVGKIKEAIEEAILEGEIPNDYEASKNYFEKIKDEYSKQAFDWEKLTK